MCTTFADVNTDLVDLVFAGPVIEWRGPSPFYFIPVPDDDAASIREVAAIATYGWGVIPVEARIGEVAFTTSLFPKDGGYLLPLKNAVRKPQGCELFERMRTPVLFCVVSFRGVAGRPALSVPLGVFGGRRSRPEGRVAGGFCRCPVLACGV